MLTEHELDLIRYAASADDAAVEAAVNKIRDMQAVLQGIHDILYWEPSTAETEGRYNADKEWDSDTIDTVASLVSEVIPRPENTDKA
jgi:hypothetical protein